jgi:hypothetical protein
MTFGTKNVKSTQFSDAFTKNNIGPTTSHVGGNGNSIFLTGIGDYFRFFFQKFGI